MDETPGRRLLLKDLFGSMLDEVTQDQLMLHRDLQELIERARAHNETDCKAVVNQVIEIARRHSNVVDLTSLSRAGQETADIAKDRSVR